ncbi:MAG: flagellar hook-length control protein FliK [Woeseiaceae bacterium]|nr:flagellar hook-length control protein FliK [Woeseiaceae bacterium]
MLATFNLQLPTLDPGAETPFQQGIPPAGAPSEPSGFAAVLQPRLTDARSIDAIAGDALPPTGNPLPDSDIAIMVEGVLLEGGGDAETPLLQVADEQPWESLVVPPELALTGIAPTAPAVQAAPVPLQTIPGAGPESETPLLVGATVQARQVSSRVIDGAEQGVPATPADPANLKPRVTPIPIDMPPSSREAIADARDARFVPGTRSPVAREIQPRDYTVTQLRQTAAGDDGLPVLQDTSARPVTPPLQQAMPVTELSGEPARPVVQTGVPQAAVATPAFQPGAFAIAELSVPSADGRFASTLQQQVTDLIDTPVREANWGDKLGERVVMMANNQLKTAEIRLTPAELGPVRVQVNVEDGAANITFQAQHAITREAIEQALPRLRELFADSGLSLGQTSVGEQNVAGNRDGNARGEARAPGPGGGFGVPDDEMPAEATLARRHDGLLDTFA